MTEDELMRDAKTDAIAATIQSWLDWQKVGRDAAGIETTPDTQVMSLPYWPSRGCLENWVAHLRSLRTTDRS